MYCVSPNRVTYFVTLPNRVTYFVTLSNLYRMVQQGKFPASKIGFQWRFNRKEIDDWVTSQRPSAAASQGREHDNDLKES